MPVGNQLRWGRFHADKRQDRTKSARTGNFEHAKMKTKSQIWPKKEIKITACFAINVRFDGGKYKYAYGYLDRNHNF